MQQQNSVALPVRKMSKVEWRALAFTDAAVRGIRVMLAALREPPLSKPQNGIGSLLREIDRG